MRKVFLLISFMVVARLVSAEQMQFVTTLSHPVGTFATVEALDATKTVQSLQVNFCNQKVSTGSIQLKGAMRAAYLKTLANTQLGGSVPAYQLKTLYLGNYNTLTGGNVIANTANPGKAKVSQTLYGPDMTYLVAELPALKIKNGSNVNANIKSGGSGTELQWSNKYNREYQVEEIPPPSEETAAPVRRRDDGILRVFQDDGTTWTELDWSDGCDGDWIKKYEGTDRTNCWDVYLDHMVSLEEGAGPLYDGALSMYPECEYTYPGVRGGSMVQTWTRIVARHTSGYMDFAPYVFKISSRNELEPSSKLPYYSWFMMYQRSDYNATAMFCWNKHGDYGKYTYSWDAIGVYFKRAKRNAKGEEKITETGKTYESYLLKSK